MRAGRADGMHFANPADFGIVRSDLLQYVLSGDGEKCVLENTYFTLYSKGEDGV